MPRYIDADAVNRVFVDELGKIPSVLIDERIEWVAAREAIIRCARGVAAIPTADVRKNIHAHWIHERLVSTGGGSYPVVRCSACQWQYPMGETRFCPNCGAQMDERSEDGEIHKC